jgi:hypothetical protein
MIALTSKRSSTFTMLTATAERFIATWWNFRFRPVLYVIEMSKPQVMCQF